MAGGIEMSKMITVFAAVLGLILATSTFDADAREVAKANKASGQKSTKAKAPAKKQPPGTGNDGDILTTPGAGAPGGHIR
jgi:hypothetical protein